MRSWHYNLGLAGILLALVCANPIASAADDEKEVRIAKLKSAFLLNFVKFTTWPDGAFAEDDSPIVITVFGNGKIVPILNKTTKGVKVHGRQIVIQHATPPDPKQIKNKDKLEQAWADTYQLLSNSHVVFCSELPDCPLGGVTAALVDRPILYVGDNVRCIRNGALLSMVQDSGRIVIYANSKASESKGVKISSKLLKLAIIVEEEE